MEYTAMIKKEYLKPAMQMVQLKHQCQILAGSLKNIETNGLGDDDLDFDGSVEIPGNAW